MTYRIRYSGNVVPITTEGSDFDFDSLYEQFHTVLPREGWCRVRSDTQGTDIVFDTSWQTSFKPEVFLHKVNKLAVRCGAVGTEVELFEFGETPGDISWYSATDGAYELLVGEVVFRDHEHGGEYLLSELQK